MAVQPTIRRTASRGGSQRGIIVAVLAWSAVMAACSVWDGHQTRASRLVGRFDYYLSRWKADEGALPEARVDALVDELGSREPFRRWWAAAALGEAAARRATPALIRAMQDDAGTVRTCVLAHNLGRIGDPRAVPALVAALEHPRNLDLRACAAVALGDIGNDQALEALKEAYLDRGAIAALRSIGFLSAPEAATFLQSVVDSAPAAIHRRIAEHGLELIRLSSSDDPVAALLEGFGELPSPSRVWAVGKLARMGDGRAIELLYRAVSDVDEEEEVRVSAGAALATFGSEAEAQIRRLLGQEDALSRAIGGLAAMRVGGVSLAADVQNAESDGFVRKCLAIARTSHGLRFGSDQVQ